MQDSAKLWILIGIAIVVIVIVFFATRTGAQEGLTRNVWYMQVGDNYINRPDDPLGAQIQANQNKNNTAPVATIVGANGTFITYVNRVVDSQSPFPASVYVGTSHEGTLQDGDPVNSVTVSGEDADWWNLTNDGYLQHLRSGLYIGLGDDQELVLRNNKSNAKQVAFEQADL